MLCISPHLLFWPVLLYFSLITSSINWWLLYCCHIFTQSCSNGEQLFQCPPWKARVLFFLPFRWFIREQPEQTLIRHWSLFNFKGIWKDCRDLGILHCSGWNQAKRITFNQKCAIWWVTNAHNNLTVCRGLKKIISFIHYWMHMLIIYWVWPPGHLCHAAYTGGQKLSRASGRSLI